MNRMTQKFVEVRIKSNSKEAIVETLKSIKQFEEVNTYQKIMPTDQGGWHVFCNLLVEVTE